MRKFPKRLKFKKYHKLKLDNKSLFKINKSKLIGQVGLKSFSQKEFTPEQIEAGRVAIKRMIRKKKKLWRIWIRLFPYCPVSKKSQGLRMGKGKGKISRWICPVKFGQILFEINHNDLFQKDWYSFRYFKGFCKVWRKLPIRVRMMFNYY